MVDSAPLVRSAFSDSAIVGSLPEPLRDYALTRCLDAASHLETIPDIFNEYTDHGIYHSCKVLKLADRLVADNDLNKWERLVFVLSAFHHDIGMSCPPEEWKTLEEQPLFRREERYIRELVIPSTDLLDVGPDAVERQVRVEYLRRQHGKRCQSWIARELPPERPYAWVEDVYAWELVSQVCVGHTLSAQEIKSDTYSRSRPIETAGSVDVRFLACLLRLADICHLSRDRALPHIRQTMRFKSGLSEKIWKALGEVAGVDCDKDRAVITVAAQPRSFEDHRMVSGFVSEIGTELQNAHRLLSDSGRYQFPWRFVDDSGVQTHSSAQYLFEPNARFRLVQDKIVNLLMGSKIYADPLYALRECLQNSVDAIRVYRLKVSHAVGRIVVQYQTCSDGSAILDVFDNGTGMDRAICLQHLLSVGSDPFAASERRYQDWGAPDGDLQLIAQHGIGFLSCFMLADRVEVFSKYHDAQRIHLILDSPTCIGEFRLTDESEFPQWAAKALPESSPWDERHGTCVRLHLKRPLSKLDLMQFLSQNVLRIEERIVIIYGNELAELPAIWGPNNDDWSAESGEEASLAALRDELFSRRDDRGLGGPPHDPSLEEAILDEGDIRGIVRIKAEDYESSRLSQEGFLIRDGVASLLGLEAGLRREGDFPFYFDLDVRRKRYFELDAERARIVDPQGDLVAELLDWIEEKGLRSIEAIESPLFFMCGESYYHGGSDLFAADDARVVAFHDTLRKWYTPERMKRIVGAKKFDPFMKAKIFAAIGEAHNVPVSLADTLEDQFFVLVPRVDLSSDTFDADLVDRSDRKRKRLEGQAAEAILKEVSGLADLGKVLFLPNFPESFSLPLSILYRFEWTDISGWALLGRLIRREALEIPEHDLIEKKFKEVGGFIDSKLLAKSMPKRSK